MSTSKLKSDFEKYVAKPESWGTKLDLISTPSLLGASTELVKPYVEITEQPTVRSKFRYDSEPHKAVPVVGVSSSTYQTKHTTIKINNYVGPVRVEVSCVTTKEPYSAHPHKLVGQSNCREGICTIQTNITENSNVVPVREIGIQCTARKRAGQNREKVSPNIDMNAVRLQFQVYIQDENGNCCRLLPRVVSDIIHQTKLVIQHVNPESGSAKGGNKVTLLCEKLNKNDVVVEFYFEKDQQKWMVTAKTDYEHKQCALVIVTPAFESTDINENVEVQIRLKRISDNSRSDPVAFTYLPVEKGTEHTRQKEPSPYLDMYNISAPSTPEDEDQWSPNCQMDTAMPGPFTNTFEKNTLTAGPSHDQAALINPAVYTGPPPKLKRPMQRELIVNVSTLPRRKKPTAYTQSKMRPLSVKGQSAFKNITTTSASMQLMTEYGSSTDKTSTTAYMQPVISYEHPVSTNMPTTSACMQPMIPRSHAVTTNKSYMTAYKQSNEQPMNITTTSASMQLMTEYGSSTDKTSTTAYMQPVISYEHPVSTNMPTTSACMQPMIPRSHAVTTNKSYMTAYKQSNEQPMTTNGHSVSTNISFTTDYTQPMTPCGRSVCTNTPTTTTYLQPNMQSIIENDQSVSTNISPMTDYMQSNLQHIISNGYCACTNIPTTPTCLQSSMNNMSQDMESLLSDAHQIHQNGVLFSLENMRQPVYDEQQQMALATSCSTSLLQNLQPSLPNLSPKELMDYISLVSDEDSLNDIMQL